MATKKEASPGRRRIFAEKLTEKIAVRLDDAQGAAIGAWCRRHKVSPATLFREVALLRAGSASLGQGIDAIKGKAEKAVTLEGAAVLPVKCTVRQANAIRAYCAKHKLSTATWVREATLVYIGKAAVGGFRAQANEVAAFERTI